MSHSDNPECLSLKCESKSARQCCQCGSHPLIDRPGVAARSIGPGDLMLPAVLCINVIETNRRRCNESYPAAFQEIGIASGPGSCDQCIGIPDIRPADELIEAMRGPVPKWVIEPA
jgi:hypothetical protein